MSTIITIFISSFITVLAVWRRSWLFYILAGFAWIIFGFDYFSDNNLMSIVIILFGIACFAGAVWDRE